MSEEITHIVVFDGDCGICSASANYIERIKKTGSLETIPSFLFDFSYYKIEESTAELTVIFIDNLNQKVYYRTRAIMEIFKHLGGIYKIIGYLLSNSIFEYLANPVYDLIARNRAYFSTKLGLNACKIRQ